MITSTTESTDEELTVGQILFAILASLFATGLLTYFVTVFPWDFADWTEVFYPAAQDPLHPYEVTNTLRFINPPWLVWLLIPFTIFPAKIAFGIWFTLSLIAAIICIHTLRPGSLYITILCLLSPPLIRLFVHGQIDVIPLVGYVVIVTLANPYLKGLGVVLLSIKPQALFLGFVTHWLSLDKKARWQILVPFVIVLSISFLIYGFWPRDLLINLQDIQTGTNVSIWPYGLPIGIGLFGYALWKKQDHLAAFSTYFFMPYVNSQTLFPYVVVLFSIVSPFWATVSFVGLWVLALVAT